MSMLSSMCTRLRSIADTLDMDGRTDEAHAVRDAADTLWELRCKLSGTVDERQEYEATLADLRYRLAESERSEGILYDLIGDMYHPDAYERLRAENEKLRELVIEQRRHTDAVHAYWAGGKTPEQFDALMKATASVNRLSEELGIEVEE